MKCPFCATLESKVVDSRPANDGTSIRRRRECLKCHNRFTTYETIEVLPMIVIKKNGNRQAFDRNKILSSMLKACEKRSVPLSKLEEIAQENHLNITFSAEQEDVTVQIGHTTRPATRQEAFTAFVIFFGLVGICAGGFFVLCRETSSYKKESLQQ